MSDIPAIDFKPKVHPLLADLPEYTKNPGNYMKIQRMLLETLACGTTHSDLHETALCPKCTDNMKERRKLMKKFGFTSSAQYMAWRAVMHKIESINPDWILPKYNS